MNDKLKALWAEVVGLYGEDKLRGTVIVVLAGLLVVCGLNHCSDCTVT